jgi:hypothetical protein
MDLCHFEKNRIKSQNLLKTFEFQVAIEEKIFVLFCLAEDSVRTQKSKCVKNGYIILGVNRFW